MRVHTRDEVNVVTAWHHMGTTRMHDDRRQGVVDPELPGAWDRKFLHRGQFRVSDRRPGQSDFDNRRVSNSIGRSLEARGEKHMNTWTRRSLVARRVSPRTVVGLGGGKLWCSVNSLPRTSNSNFAPARKSVPAVGRCEISWPGLPRSNGEHGGGIAAATSASRANPVRARITLPDQDTFRA